MKQTSFTVKNLGGNIPEKQSTIVKRSFRSSTKPLSLDSTIHADELTAETFYRFKISELFNIWTPPFWCTDPSTWLTPLHESQYVTHSPTWGRRMLAAKFFTSSIMKIKKHLGYKTLRHKNAVASFRENKALVTFWMCSPCILICDGL